jgi:phage minor structural protein
MLKIFNKDHESVGEITKYRDCKVESDVDSGDKSLAFTYLGDEIDIINEMYIQTQDDEYVVKEISESTDGFPEIVAALNLEELEANSWQTFTVTDVTIDEAAKVVLAGTGWTIGECDVTKKRNAGMVMVSSLSVIQNLCTAFMCDPVFDTINKKVSFYEQRGEDKGVYFLSGLNLKKLQKKATSYDFYTRIIPIGADDMTISSVNDGKNYLENFQYSNKIRTYIWEDDSYTDPQAMKDDAEKKLNDLSKPEVSYSADVRDLAKQKEEYSVLSYGLGDTITIIDQKTGTREKQRIKKMTEYESNPDNNTCEIGNTFLTFEELQEKMQAAAEIVNYAFSSDGKIYVSDILNFESGVAGTVTVSQIQGDISDAQSDIDGLQDEIGMIHLSIGELETNTLKSEEAYLIFADIDSLKALDAYIEEMSNKWITTENLSAESAKLGYVKSDELESTVGTFGYMKSNFSNVEIEDVGLLFGNIGILDNVTIKDGSVTGELKGVKIAGDLIETNTLAVKNLILEGEDGLIYQINALASGLSQTELADEQYQSKLSGLDLVSKSVTTTQLDVDQIFGNEAILKKITSSETMSDFIATNQLIVGASKNAKSALEYAQKAIDSVQVLYAQGDSETTAPTSGWSATATEWISGKYMWQKTVTKYKNGDTSESDPTCITGAKGETGSTGVGILSVTPLYYCTNSTSTPSRPTAAVTTNSSTGDNAYNRWNKAVAAWTSTYKYYFVSSEILYTNNDRAWTDPVRNSDMEMSADAILSWCKDNNLAYIDGSKIYVDEAFVNKIFAKDITATGTISGATLTGALIKADELYIKQAYGDYYTELQTGESGTFFGSYGNDYANDADAPYAYLKMFADVGAYLSTNGELLLQGKNITIDASNSKYSPAVQILGDTEINGVNIAELNSKSITSSFKSSTVTTGATGNINIGIQADGKTFITAAYVVVKNYIAIPWVNSNYIWYLTVYDPVTMSTVKNTSVDIRYLVMQLA